MSATGGRCGRGSRGGGRAASVTGAAGGTGRVAGAAGRVVDLAAHFDNDGVSRAERPADGAFNIWGNTFPAEELPAGGSLVEVGGILFRFPDTRDGALNNLRCARQLIEVPAGRYD